MDRIPYSCQAIEEEDIEAVAAVLRSPFLTQGPEIVRFEAAIAEMHGAAHAVAACNATAALHIACMALGLGPGDRLWTSPISFTASANCGLYCGATVDFVDIDPVTRNMSVEALAAKLDQASRTGQLPKIVVPVDFSGLPCDMPAMRKLADQYGFSLIQDASHAVGAQIDGHPIGRDADIVIFSFHPVKIVTTGEGGVAVTQDAELARQMALLRSHGITRDENLMTNPSEGGWYYEQIMLGYNYRMTDLQAALGLSQLSRLPAMWQKREERARRYDDLLSELPLRLPARANDRQSAHHLYVIEIDETRSTVTRRELYDRLSTAGIGANVHYIPIHLQPHYRNMGFEPGDFPAAEAYYRRAITIPLFPRMTDEQQDRVVDCLKSALA